MRRALLAATIAAISTVAHAQSQPGTLQLQQVATSTCASGFAVMQGDQLICAEVLLYAATPVPVAPLPVAAPVSPDALVGAVTPAHGSFTDAKGNVYAIDAAHGDVATINGAPINSGAYDTSQLMLASDGSIWGQDRTSRRWYDLTSNGAYWTPMPSRPPGSQFVHPPSSSVVYGPVSTTNSQQTPPAPGVPLAGSLAPATPTQPSLPCGAATGGFSTLNDQIIGPDGKPFVAKGIREEWNGRKSASELTGAFPGINHVSVGLWSIDEASVADIVAYARQLTAAGIEVNIQDFEYPTVVTGDALTKVANWYGALASQLKDDKDVTFSTQNEPCCDAGAVNTEVHTIYDAIRATGNDTLVLVTPIGGDGTQGLNLSGMQNVAWDLHYYNWISNYSTDLGANQTALLTTIDNAKATADVPVIVDEYGDSTDGSKTDPGWQSVVQAVQSSEDGSAAFGLCSCGAGADLLFNDDGSLSAYGREVANFIASPTSPGTSTPLSTLAGTCDVQQVPPITNLNVLNTPGFLANSPIMAQGKPAQ